jgi:hypothetical protein
MTANYIPRTLIANRGRHDENVIGEADILYIDAPIVILGDPGLGKTELTKSLEDEFGFVRVSAGAFYRNHNLTRFHVPGNTKIIIDGLDEITSSSGVSAIDEILKKLSQIGNPNFILSCRSADWQGSTDRHKIGSDYGAEPVTLNLQPFTYNDAKQFLDSYGETINADRVLRELDEHDLSEFYVNPLTLTLVAEIVAAGQGLPKGRTELLDRATELLVSEVNPAHQRSPAAQSSLDNLLDSAGAIFAHLLLSGSIGITDRPREYIPDGYVPIGELNDITDALRIPAAVKTRLFQSPDENLYTPFHRVIAEYLGARWLSNRISRGLSERRVFQALTFAGGVPTGLRGLHAWLAHFSPQLAPRCIKTDPYGVLRYGEPDHLPLEQARLLLNSLASLANEDPYFRSEDWGKRAITGLARLELKDDIVALIKAPDRHVHLSTLVLEALDGSQLTNVIAPELMAVVENAAAAYIERLHAAEALSGSGVDVDWPTVAQSLQARKATGDKRLALEITALARGAGFSGGQIANAILDYQKFPARSGDQDDPEDDETDDDLHVSGMVYGITRKISPRLSGEVLDEIALRIQRSNKPIYWRPGYELSSSIHQLVEKAIEDDQVPSPERAWTWLKLTEGERDHSAERKQPIHDWLLRNPDLRRKIQKIAFNRVESSDGPWIAIVHDLPTVNQGLALTLGDTAELLIEIGSKDGPNDFDIALWADLVRSRRNNEGVSSEIQAAVNFGMRRHSVLGQQWKKLIAPPKRDWKKEEEHRKADREEKQARKYAKHRASFWPARDKIASGAEIGALNSIAKAYLGRYSDLDRDAQPDVRVRKWLGDELTSAALAGFVAYLSRDDIPSARQIAETHADGKEWNVEPILVCGIVELVRSGQTLAGVDAKTAAAALAAWWEYSDFNSRTLGDETERQLERLVFSSEQSIEDFLSSVIEPRIGAGQQHVPGLYRMAREDRFIPAVSKLTLKWLASYPSANASIQLELLKTAVEHSPSRDVQNLVRKRLSENQTAETEIQRIWMAAAFVVDFYSCEEVLAKFFNNKDHLWALREMVRPERSERRVIKPVSIQQLEFIVPMFADKWPPVRHPSSGWGDTHPWNATEFIRGCINAIGSNSTEDASASLDRLISVPSVQPYLDQLKHVRAQQLRLRRDTEFCVPTFGEVKQTLSNGLPGNIDDLKSMVLDRLEIVQDYLRNGDTKSWEAFWTNDRPKDENTCRDRLLDQLRPRLPFEVTFLPEITMPEANRADIVVIYHKYGLPIEIKGQWHTKVWNAADVQLIQKYARDWRADDRGIYLVLWFGNVPSKNLPKHPDGLPPPSSAEALRQMLLNGLLPSELSRIDVFVLDVSKP